VNLKFYHRLKICINLTRKDILRYAHELGVPPDTIDKDWVLGNFLEVLFSYSWAQENLIFKGGTCLRKCYFENYRFSEDVDLTVTNVDFVLTKNHLTEVCKTLFEKYDIHNIVMSFKKVQANGKEVGWDAEICYWGANHNPNDTPIFRNVCHTKIILEIRHYGKIIFSPHHLKIIHQYPSIQPLTSLIPCYSIEEILSEKLRSILPRNRGEARDFFDIWYISRNYTSDINWNHVKEAFLTKCAFKNIAFNHPDDFFNEKRLQQVNITWEKRLSHQLQMNVDREKVLEELKKFIQALFK
jgi:predicted nucleotidyltransferase component of viral defense system